MRAHIPDYVIKADGAIKCWRCPIFIGSAVGHVNTWCEQGPADISALLEVSKSSVDHMYSRFTTGSICSMIYLYIYAISEKQDGGGRINEFICSAVAAVLQLLLLSRFSGYDRHKQ